MPGQSYGLEDGSCSYKDFSESRNNRFSTPEQAAKNRIQHPSNVLHFFNAPLEVTEENFFEVGAVELVLHHSRLNRLFVLAFQQISVEPLLSARPWVGSQGCGRDQDRWAETDTRLSLHFSQARMGGFFAGKDFSSPGVTERWSESSLKHPRCQALRGLDNIRGEEPVKA